MPSLSFSRDHRGYEYTALVHTGRRRGAAEQRILYWFRTPPGIRFGRVPIDEDVIRALEENNPGLNFDWDRILQPPPPPPTKRAFDARTKFRGPRRVGAEAPPAKAPAAVQVEQAPVTRPELPQPGPADRTELPSKKRKRRRRRDKAPAPVVEANATPTPDQATAPAADAFDGEPEPQQEEAGWLENEADVEAAAEPSAVTPAASVLGHDGLARLQTRHAELMARITERISETDRADALRDRAQQLNPDAWVTSDDVRAGLEHYEQVYQELRQALGPAPFARGHGRRRRRSGRHAGPDAAPESS